MHDFLSRIYYSGHFYFILLYCYYLCFVSLIFYFVSLLFYSILLYSISISISIYRWTILNAFEASISQITSPRKTIEATRNKRTTACVIIRGSRVAFSISDSAIEFSSDRCFQKCGGSIALDDRVTSASARSRNEFIIPVKKRDPSSCSSDQIKRRNNARHV